MTVMGDYYNTDDAYEEVKEMISDKHAAKDEYVDSNFNEATYHIGMSGKRTVKSLQWSNGKTIAITYDMGEGEIVWLQAMPYDVAILVA